MAAPSRSTRSAGVGAAAIAPLSMLPARSAEVPSVDAVVVAGLSAALGAVAGVFVALAVLAHRTIAWNVAAVTELMWILALISVAPSLGPDDPLPEVRLGVLDPSWLSDSTAQRLAVVAMPALALCAGAGQIAAAEAQGRETIERHGRIPAPADIAPQRQRLLEGVHHDGVVRLMLRQCFLD